MTPKHATPVRRRGFSYRGLAIVLVALVAVPAVAWSLWLRLPWNSQEVGPKMFTVERGEFVYEITDRGNMESANNTEIKCEVKSKNQAGTQILEVVPEGTEIKPEDVGELVLVRLDSSALENERTTQQIACAKSKADLIQAEAACKTALIAQKEYEEGTYGQSVQAIESERLVAKENRDRAKEYLEYSRALFAKRYVTKAQLQADTFAVEKAESDLKIADEKLKVLAEFTRQKQLTQLQCDVDTTAAKLEAAKAGHSLDTNQLKLIEDQIKKCEIKAPQEGTVVYANVTGFRGTKEIMIAAGEMARERQVLIRLPDPKQMQVVAKINEAKIAKVRERMSAVIRLDAFPDAELQGTVKKVDAFPVPSWFGSVVKEYETTVEIHDAPPGLKLKPGLTAQVRILVESQPSVLQIPVQALFEHGAKFYCVVPSGRSWKAKEVQISASNDKFVVVEGGLEQGEQIVFDADAYREKVKLPELPRDRGRRSGGAVVQSTRSAEGGGPQLKVAP
jgi:multidrug resistance efflux pump